MNTCTVPLFDCLEAGPIIAEAIRLRDTYHLHQRPNVRESFSILEAGMGPLVNYEVLFLLDEAVSRMVDNLRHEPSPQDYYVHGTIHHLYHRYTRRFLENSFVEPRQDVMLEALIRRLINRNLSHTHEFNFEQMQVQQWTLLIDMGEVLLAQEFPADARQCSLKNIPGRDYADPDTWLDEIWNKLKCDLQPITTAILPVQGPSAPIATIERPGPPEGRCPT